MTTPSPVRHGRQLSIRSLLLICALVALGLGTIGRELRLVLLERQANMHLALLGASFSSQEPAEQGFKPWLRRYVFAPFIEGAAQRIDAIHLPDFVQAPDDLAMLARFRWLELLALETPRDTTLRGLPAGLRIRRLQLMQGQLSADGVGTLKRLPNLQQLDLVETRLARDTLASLIQLPHLQQLTIGQVRMSRAELHRLLRTPTLQTLTCVRLTLHGDFPEADDAAPCPLKHLVLANTALGPHGLALLGTAPNLQRLELHGLGLGRQEIDNLARFQQLVDLRIEAEPLTADTLACIAQLPRLETLDLNSVGWLAGGLEHLAGHPRLRAISLGACSLEPASLAHLATCEELRELRLVSVRAAPPAASANAGLATRRSRSSRGSRWPEDWPQHLVALQRLEFLTVADTRLQGPGLRYLAEVPALRMLRLEESGVTDDDLLALDVWPDLHTFWYRGRGRITRRGLDHLRQLRPDMQIERLR